MNAYYQSRTYVNDEAALLKSGKRFEEQRQIDQEGNKHEQGFKAAWLVN